MTSTTSKQPASHTEKSNQMSTAPKAIAYRNDKKSIEAVRGLLSEINGTSYSVDQGVARHDDPPNKISLPDLMSLRSAADQLNEAAIAAEQMEEYNHQFKYRPEDGAYAVTQVMEKFFGTPGRGKATASFFGVTPPQKINVEVAPGESVTVPWGEIEFAPVDGTINLGAYRDPEFGVLFAIQVQCPQKFQGVAKGFCKLVEDELRENSIYKGKAIYIAEGGSVGGNAVRFIDAESNPTIVYNEDVEASLHTTVWGVIQHRELLKADRRKVNNRVLMHGPYGTGKSEAGMRTAAVAVEHNTTFINFLSGKSTLDDLERTIAMARLYSPAVVFVEDVDVYAQNEDEAFQTRLSNLFDGIGSKGDEVMIVMTSNHAAKFSKGMLRAGRIDSMVEVGALDRDATKKMINLVIGQERLAEDLDFDKIWEAMDGFEPAFVRQTFDQAATSALLRTGSRTYVLTTEDFVTAANLKRPQHELHTSKKERKVTTFDSAMRTLVDGAVVDVLSRTSGSIDGDMEGELDLSISPRVVLQELDA